MVCFFLHCSNLENGDNSSLCEGHKLSLEIHYVLCQLYNGLVVVPELLCDSGIL